MPYINVEVDVDLTDFDTADLIEELESRGRMPEADFNPAIDLSRIEHLIVCGQIEQAKAESWAMITKALETT